VEKYGTARQATDDIITRRMRFACWITKATDIHSKYVILIAFPRQQWLRERASVLHYTYIACPLHFSVRHGYIPAPLNQEQIDSTVLTIKCLLSFLILPLNSKKAT
jgi:hypothetical protein